MRWNKVDLRPLFASFPEDFRLTVADVGSIGGLHSRWRRLRNRLVTISFDPLDPRATGEATRCYPYLIGDREGTATLNITRRPSMSSTLTPDPHFYAAFWDKPEDTDIVETIEAEMIRLDTLMQRERLSPDAIKIDVQGGEAAVIAGAAETLRGSVMLAEIECSFAARYEGQETFDQIMTRMRDLGFALLDLRRLKRYRYRNTSSVHDPSLGRGMRAGRLAFCDAIFMIEPETLWQRVDAGAEHAGLKALTLFLVYGKADLAAAVFDRAADAMPGPARDACAAFFKHLENDGGWRQRLHLSLDRWVQRV